MTDRTEVTPEDAERSLADVEARRRQAIDEELRDPAWVMPATALIIAAKYALKDRRGRRGHRAGVAVLMLAWTAHTVAVLRDRRISLHDSTLLRDEEELGRAILESVGISLGMLAAERAVAAGFRRTRLRHPNTVAGIVLGIAMPPASQALRRHIVARGTGR